MAGTAAADLSTTAATADAEPVGTATSTSSTADPDLGQSFHAAAAAPNAVIVTYQSMGSAATAADATCTATKQSVRYALAESKPRCVAATFCGLATAYIRPANGLLLAATAAGSAATVHFWSGAEPMATTKFAAASTKRYAAAAVPTSAVSAATIPASAASTSATGAVQSIWSAVRDSTTSNACSTR